MKKSLVLLLLILIVLIKTAPAYAAGHCEVYKRMACPGLMHLCSYSNGIGDNRYVSCCDVRADCATAAPAVAPTTTINPKICDFVPEGTQRTKCLDCFEGTTPGVWTAVGCIKTNTDEFISKLLKFGTGIAGGIAFLLILFGGLQIMTSSGNPEKLHAGSELITAAITGLLFIIFSIFLLRLIGVDILAIPGFK